MKLSLCPRSAFPARIVEPAPPSDEIFDLAALRHVESLPPRRDPKSGPRLRPRVCENEPRSES